MRIIVLLTLTFLTGCAAFALPTVAPNSTVAPTNALATPSPTLRPSPVPTATPADTATIRATVYVREAADAASAEVGSLETGQSVEIVGCDGSWCEIEYMFENEVVTGFVFRGCLSDNPDGLKCEVRE
jgi:hypothetical protein